jgi:DNA-binding HxlR family transcriptional regulator
MKSKHLTVSERDTYRRLEDVVGCKWSAAIVAALGRGVHRPGQLERFIPGISTKVLTERLRRMLAYGLITRTEYSELPLRVEYHLTPVGENSPSSSSSYVRSRPSFRAPQTAAEKQLMVDPPRLHELRRTVA